LVSRLIWAERSSSHLAISRKGTVKLTRIVRDDPFINPLDELRVLDVGLVTLGEGLDTTTPSVRMTPATEAGIANHVWSIEEVVALLEAR